MRIRKGRLARGSAHASLVMASQDHTDDINQRLELASSSRGFQQKVQGSETVEQSQSNNPSANPSFEKAPLALSLEKLQISSTGESIPPERPYMTLDEFVTSLARKNCFPADEHSDDPRSDEDSDKNISGQSSYNLTNTPVLINLYRSDDEEPQDMGKRSGAVSPGSADDLRDDIAAVETSLRLATPGSYKPASPRTSMEVEAAAAAEQVVQTMKSSTESMEQGSGRHTRLSSSPGRKRAAAVFFYDDDYEDEEEEEEEEEETDATDAQDEASSDYSNQKAESAPANERKKEKNPQVSSSAPIPVAKRTMKRSGRPKKLKYMQQDNVEELGNQCNRRDGKGWTCPLLAKPGYQLCDHHLDKLRCKPGSRSKYNKSKKKKSK